MARHLTAFCRLGRKREAVEDKRVFAATLSCARLMSEDKGAVPIIGNQKPKPCPFCKSGDVFVERFGACVHGVVCNHCLVNGPRSSTGNISKARTDDED